MSSSEERQAGLDAATSIIVHTGNVLSHVKRHLVTDVREEVKSEWASALKSWLRSGRSPDAPATPSVEGAAGRSECVVDARDAEVPGANEERGDITLTVKVFLADGNAGGAAALERAVRSLLALLHVGHVDQLMIAVPSPTATPADEADVGRCDVAEWVQAHFIAAWRRAEELQAAGLVRELCVCDFSKLTLDALLAAAKVHPSADQVNLTDCCVMPKDLIGFAKERDVQLLTHTDPHVLISREAINEWLEAAADTWSVSWAARYTSTVKCRGVIGAKGYIVASEKSA